MEPRIVFTIRQLLPASEKDALPASQQSKIVYKFSCHCDSRYVDRISQRLQGKIKQHVPKSVRTGQFSQDHAVFNRSFKLTNQPCALHYSDGRFSILSKGHSAFHLSALKAIKVSQPILCRQKELVYALKISY